MKKFLFFILLLLTPMTFVNADNHASLNDFSLLQAENSQTIFIKGLTPNAAETFAIYNLEGRMVYLNTVYADEYGNASIVVYLNQGIYVIARMIDNRIIQSARFKVFGGLDENFIVNFRR